MVRVVMMDSSGNYYQYAEVPKWNKFYRQHIDLLVPVWFRGVGDTPITINVMEGLWEK